MIRDRAEAFGKRLMKVQGGSSKPIFLVLTSTAGADYSRGVSGISSVEEIEFRPRPTWRYVTGVLVTVNGKVIRQGDIEIDFSNRTFDEDIISNPLTRFRLGSKDDNGTLLEIVTYQHLDYMKNIVYWRVYARGITGP